MRSPLDRIHRFVDGPLGALAGGAIYGGWAFFANLSAAGARRAALIGCVHFLISVFLTFAGVKVMNALFAWGGPSWRGGSSALVGALTLDYAVLVGVHLWLGTPHILLTLAPGLLPNICFCFAYTLLLLRARSNPPARTTEMTI